MTSETLLDAATEQLGYAESSGYERGAAGGIADARGFVWRDLRDKCRVDATYFRGGVPLVAFARTDSEADLREVHTRLWNFSRVPILIASSPAGVSAYSCFSPPPASGGRDSPLRHARSEQDILSALREFSRFHVETGRTVQAFSQHFKRSTRVDRRLLENLRSLRKRLGGDDRKRVAVDGLIGRSIFVRFMEDRGILSPEHVAQLVPQEGLLDVLTSGTQSTREFFGALADRFSGDVFRKAASDVESVSNDDLGELASFFAGATIATGQQALWPYDFSIIPPELISSIYEQLLEDSQRRDAAYYTPRSVVDLILDEVMPWDEPPPESILDPACGSGIFLTEAFRRLTYRALNRGGHHQLAFGELSGLLTGSVFGIDQSEVAVSVAAFGLYLALLEEVDPPTAWEQGRLPELVNSNLVARDFFAEHALSDREYDVIVGNPPWQARLSRDAARFVDQDGRSIANQQLALAFMWKARRLLREDGVLGMLLPAKPLLHNKSPRAIATRNEIFRAFYVETLIDLSALRHDLFASATGPATVFVARHQPRRPPHAGEILHVAPRNSPLQATIDGFVVSHDDVHRVPRGESVSTPDIWKILLWGSHEDVRLITDLRVTYPTVATVASDRDWVHGRGFELTGDRNDASHLVGMRFIPTEAVQPLAIREARRVTASVMHRPRDPHLYRGPHVLFRRGLVRGRLAVAFVPGSAAFNNGVFGVSATKNDAELLRLLTAFSNSSLGHYYHFMTSASWGVERDFVEESEFLSLPFALPEGRQTKRVLEALSFAEDEGLEAGLSKLDMAVFDAYGLSRYDIELVRETLSVRLSLFERGRRSHGYGPPTSSEFRRFTSSLGRRLMESLPSMTFKSRMSDRSDTYAVATVRIGSEEASDYDQRRQGVLSSLEVQDHPDDWPSPSTILQPTLYVMDESHIHIVKPNELRFWTTRSAATDAAAVIGSIVAQFDAARAEARR